MSIYPTVRPSLTLDFQKSKQLDPRISFSRSSSATYVEGGVVKYADEHQARFEDEGLLIEESRTNLLPESGNLNDQAYWHTSTNPGGINQAANYGWFVATSNTTEIVSPDGTNNAVKLSGLTTSTNDKNYQVYTVPKVSTISMSMNTVYSYTVWINDPDSIFDGVNNVFVLMHGGLYSNTNPRATFDLANNTVTFGGDISSDPTGRVEVYPNGWKKLTASFANTVSDGTPRYYLQELSPNTGTVTQFSANGEKFYAFGFQIEEGFFPSSYIPTSGSTVTRAADTARITGTNFSSWYNQSEGTIYAKFAGQTYATGGTSRILSFADDDLTTMSAGNGILFGSHTGGSDTQRWRVRGPSTTSFDLATALVGSTALAYATSDLAMLFDGGTIQSSTNSPPTALDRLNIFPANVPICRIAYYSERLTDTQLEAITS